MQQLRTLRSTNINSLIEDLNFNFSQLLAHPVFMGIKGDDGPASIGAPGIRGNNTATIDLVAFNTNYGTAYDADDFNLVLVNQRLSSNAELFINSISSDTILDDDHLLLPNGRLLRYNVETSNYIDTGIDFVIPSEAVSESRVIQLIQENANNGGSGLLFEFNMLKKVVSDASPDAELNQINTANSIVDIGVSSSGDAFNDITRKIIALDENTAYENDQQQDSIFIPNNPFLFSALVQRTLSTNLLHGIKVEALPSMVVLQNGTDNGILLGDKGASSLYNFGRLYRSTDALVLQAYHSYDTQNDVISALRIRKDTLSFDGSATFSNVVISDLVANRLIATNGSKQLASSYSILTAAITNSASDTQIATAKAVYDFVLGSAGLATLAGTHIITGNYTFNNIIIASGIRLTSLTQNRVIATDANKNLSAAYEIVTGSPTGSNTDAQLPTAKALYDWVNSNAGIAYKARNETINGTWTFSSSITANGLRLTSLTADRILATDGNSVIASPYELVATAPSVSATNIQIPTAKAIFDWINSGASLIYSNRNQTLAGEYEFSSNITFSALTANRLLSVDANKLLVTAYDIATGVASGASTNTQIPTLLSVHNTIAARTLSFTGVIVGSGSIGANIELAITIASIGAAMLNPGVVSGQPLLNQGSLATDDQLLIYDQSNSNLNRIYLSALQNFLQGSIYTFVTDTSLGVVNTGSISIAVSAYYQITGVLWHLTDASGFTKLTISQSFNFANAPATNLLPENTHVYGNDNPSTPNYEPIPFDFRIYMPAGTYYMHARSLSSVMNVKSQVAQEVGGSFPNYSYMQVKRIF